MISKCEAIVSIIVPVYNASTYLDTCLKSIVEQTYSYLDIILVDDYSTDQSLSICQMWQNRDKRIRIIQHEKNKGVSAARNTGLQSAKGRYISFVDADDWIDKSFVEKLVDVIEDNDIVACGYEKIGKKAVHEYLIGESGNYEQERFVFHTICDNKIGSYACNKLFRYELIDNIRFDESLIIGEDLEFVIQYVNKCKTYKYINECLYKYRMVEQSAMNKKVKGSANVAKWNSALNAVEKIETIINNNSEYIKYCVCYRKIRSSLWVMLHMIMDGYYDKKISIRLKENTRDNIRNYYKLGYGSIIQNIVVLLMFFSPRLIYWLGRRGYEVCDKIILRRL